MGLASTIARLLFGGGLIPRLAEQLRLAHEAKLQADTEEQVLAAEHDMQRLENAIRIAEVANQDRLSATSIGRYLIVIPFGVWWAAIFAVQLLNPWFGLTLVVVDVPPHIKELAWWLVPVIVAGDVGKSAVRSLRR